jgi:hypothetical protein
LGDHFSEKKFGKIFSDEKKFVIKKVTKFCSKKGVTFYRCESVESWSSKFFLHFYRANTRACFTQVITPGLRPSFSSIVLRSRSLGKTSLSPMQPKIYQYQKFIDLNVLKKRLIWGCFFFRFVS